jgi:ABC-type sugar transport system substrate-binding protein
MPCAYAPGAAPRRRRLLRLGAAFCITAGVAATSTGCARQESGRRALSIAVIPKGTSHEFWKSVHAGAVKASRELSSADQTGIEPAQVKTTQPQGGRSSGE